ncbi:efflux RND transporter permease subunit [Terriglobus albidus]|uniref:Efflux RND transporter permease subunit n=1 Tax=Terriglobus albidus TaxID=1592106 RepID=A0A5B9EAS9_9BACT|nr:CusA/CzcA family heavy metal efflux RND transporter [Terriglobus albidus]QEE27521.1 efflux RND transporter permease subunit [Terriglobus albidus]
MISQILRFALRQRFITLLLCLLLIGFGLWSFEQLKIEAYPDISDTQVEVITTYPGLAAQEMEQQITIPLERALNNAPKLEARRSRTIYGLSIIDLTFAYGTDDYFARQVVNEKLGQVTLPPGVVPSLAPLSTPIGEMYRFTLEGPQGMGEMQLRELEDWVIAPRLLQVPGVADVTPFGGLIKQYQIAIDPALLEKYGLTVNTVVNAVKSNNRNAGGAVIDNTQQSMVVRGTGLLRSTDDIANIVLTAIKGTPVLVKDVGTVQIGAALQTGIFGLNQKSGGIEGIVLMRRGENPSEVLAALKDAITELNETRLPPGVRIVPIYDRTELVDNTLHTVSHTLLEGFIIVILVLMFFLGSPKAALLTAITVPLSLLFAFICMYLNGVPANLLSLGALDFGIIVDGTLVMVEHIVRNLAHRKPMPGEGVMDVIRDSALEVERPIFFSLLILIAAYIPLFTLQRVERRLFTPMAFTVCSALVGSLLLALTVIPVLATYLFRDKFPTWENPVLGWLSERYERVLHVLMERPRTVVLAASGIVLAALLIGGTLGSEFLPTLDEGVIWIRANLPPGISLQESSHIASDMRAIIQSYPEVKLVTSQTGRNDSGTDPFGPNRNEMLIALKPYNTWPSGVSKADLIQELRARLNREIPGATLNFTQPIIDTVTETITGSSADLAVIISGPDLAELRGLANASLKTIRDVKGSTDVSIEQEADQPGLRIDVDRGKIARYGLNIEDVNSIIESAVGGIPVGTLYDRERQFDVITRYVPSARSTPSDIGNLLLHTADGGRVPLRDVASIQVVNGASIVARRENERQITVRTNIIGRDQGGFVAEAQEHFASQIKLPPGYRVTWGGQFENLDRARRRLYVIMPVTIGIIFALLFFAFGSTSNALLVLINVPFSAVGGILLLWLRGMHFSVSAAVGFISLFGVAVMSGVLYISEINRRRHEDGASLEEAVIQGAKSQLRPRLILILVALLGMVPAATAVGIGSDVQRPLASVVVGGLLSTLFLTLLALPSLYYLVEHRKEQR